MMQPHQHLAPNPPLPAECLSRSPNSPQSEITPDDITATPGITNVRTPFWKDLFRATKNGTGSVCYDRFRGEKGGRTAPVEGPENVILGGRVCFERAAVWEGQLGSCLLV